MCPPPQPAFTPRAPPLRRATAPQVSLVVATAEGLLYEYSVEELAAPGGPKTSLAGEWTLLGSGA